MKTPWFEEPETNVDDSVKDSEEKPGEDGESALSGDTDEKETPSDLFIDEDDVPDSEKHTVEGSDEPMMKVKTFKTRISKIIAQREEARGKLDELTQELSTVTGERDGLKAVLSDMREKYKENPNLALWDAAFMDRLEQMAQEDPALATLTRKVAEHLEGVGDTKIGSITMTDVKKAANEAEDSFHKQTAERLDTMIKAQARTLIHDTLEGVKAPFIEIIADHIVNTAPKVEGLTRSDVVRLSKQFLTDKGLSQEDVLVAPPGKGDGKEQNSDGKKAAQKPGTGEKGGRAAANPKTTPRVAEEDDGPPETPPKTLEEFETQRAARRRKLFESDAFQD